MNTDQMNAYYETKKKSKTPQINTHTHTSRFGT